jgi:SagB-type dehydrogenase family enzyme
MQKTLAMIAILCMAVFLTAQESMDIKLPVPDKEGGMPLMKALSVRASAREFDTKMVDLQQISELLWAANGINRPDAEKRTASSALNAQDIDLYLLMNEKAYLYDPAGHFLKFIAAGDFRAAVAGTQEVFATVPVMVVLVSDISRFRFGEEATRLNWAALDAGIVSQNISLYCTSASLGTVPRATMDIPKIREVLQLKDTQHPILNHPVGYKK